MINFTTVEEMKDKILKSKELTNELINIMSVQFPIEDNNFDHSNTNQFCTYIKIAQEYIKDIENDLNKYEKRKD